MHYLDIENAYDLLYEFALDKAFVKFIDEAEVQYTLGDDLTNKIGFNEWFIFDFIIPNEDKTISKLFLEKNHDSISSGVSNSYRSIFEISIKDEYIILYDIFIQQELEINHSFFIKEGLYSLRIVNMDGKNYIIGDQFEIEPIHKDSIKKYVLNQYNHYCKLNHNYSLVDFINSNNKLILKVTEIAQESFDAYFSEEEFQVFQAVYAFDCPTEVIVDKILSLDPFKLYSDEEEDKIYRLYLEDDMVAEIEIETRFINVLSVSEYALNNVKDAFEALLDDHFKFIKTEVLTIDEIL